MSSKRVKPRLGRGLSSLMGIPVSVDPSQGVGNKEVIDNITSDNQRDEAAESRESVVMDDGGGEVGGDGGGLGVRRLRIWSIRPNPQQPRKKMEQSALASLAASIRTAGVMQPVLVRRSTDGAEWDWELVAGERRWRAGALAGLEEIPAIVVELTDQEAAEWAIVENVQREDLDPMERGWAFRNLVERYGLSQGEVGARVGMERSSVANLIRLTELEPEVQELIASGGLSAGHGKALMGMAAGEARVALAQRAARESWSVRETERRCAAAGESGGAAVRGGGGGAEGSARTASSPAVADLERRLSEYLGTKVVLRTDRTRHRGKMVVDFYDVEHFEGIMRRMGYLGEG